jgi:multiple sugar transport system ATP-binding protein
MAEIRVQNLHKAFDDFVAVQDSDFTVPDGSFFVMLGPSGCGKTTTLRMIAGLEMPTSGQIFLDRQDVTTNRASSRDIAFVFQHFGLYPHMNVRRNISFPLVCQGVARREVKQRVREVARLLRIDHLLNSPVGRLSGGDRQRVALGRAIVREPKAFMMDEPLGALDTEFRALMCQELRALHDRLHATTVYVTHDQLEAMSLADTIAVMNHGVIEQIGAPQDIYDYPANLFVADFIGNPPMNFLAAHCGLEPGQRSIALGEADVPIPSPTGGLAPADIRLGVRPEHVRFEESSRLRGEIIGVDYLGTTQIVTVETAYGRVKARLPASIAARIGERVGLAFKTDELSLFATETGRAVSTSRHAEAGHG